MPAVRTPIRTEFLADVLTTAVEGGINYWAFVSEYKLSPIAYAAIEELEPGFDDEVVRKHIGLPEIATAIGKIVRGETGLAGDYVAEIRLANRENDAGEIDAGLADCIVQVAMFGDVIYG